MKKGSRRTLFVLVLVDENNTVSLGAVGRDNGPNHLVTLWDLHTSSCLGIVNSSSRIHPKSHLSPKFTLSRKSSSSLMFIIRFLFLFYLKWPNLEMMMSLAGAMEIESFLSRCVPSMGFCGFSTYSRDIDTDTDEHDSHNSTITFYPNFNFWYNGKFTPTSSQILVNYQLFTTHLIHQLW